MNSNNEMKITEWARLTPKAQNNILNQLNGVDALQLIKTLKEYENETKYQ